MDDQVCPLLATDGNPEADLSPPRSGQSQVQGDPHVDVVETLVPAGLDVRTAGDREALPERAHELRARS